MTARVARILIFVLAAIYIFAYIVTFGVNVPFMDEWGLAPLVVAAKRHEPLWAYLWGQNNEHRLVFPRLIWALTLPASHFNSFIGMFLSAGCGLVTLGSLAIVETRLRGTGEPDQRSVWALLLAAALLFSPVHFDTYLWAFQFAFMAVQCFGCAAIAVLAGARFQPAVRFAAAAGLCVLASFSSAHGLLSWGAALPVLLLSDSFRWRRIWAVSWCLLAIATGWIYSLGFVRRAEWGLPDIFFCLRHPMAGFRFVMCLIGAPLAQGFAGGTTRLAFWIGLLLTVALCLALWFRRHSKEQVLPVACMAIYGFLICIAIAIGRGAWGDWLAASQSRYMCAGVLVDVAAFLLLVRVLTFARVCWVLVAILACLSVNYRSGWTQSGSLREGRARSAALLPILHFIDRRTDLSPVSVYAPLYPFRPFAEVVRTNYELLSEAGLKPTVDLSRELKQGPWLTCGPGSSCFVRVGTYDYQSRSTPVMRIAGSVTPGAGTRVVLAAGDDVERCYGAVVVPPGESHWELLIPAGMTTGPVRVWIGSIGR